MAWFAWTASWSLASCGGRVAWLPDGGGAGGSARAENASSGGNASGSGGNGAAALGGFSATLQEGFDAAPTPQDSPRRLASGDFFTCAIETDETVTCWGDNRWGQLGNGTTAERSPPVKVSDLTHVFEIATGMQHACALRLATAQTEGGVWCWGANGAGQLGDGTLEARSKPARVPGLDDVVQIAAGPWGNHTCARRDDGTVACWGGNPFGEIGDSTTANGTTANTVEGLDDAIYISAAASETCAVRSDGTVECWGSNLSGQLGDGTWGDHHGRGTVADLTDADAVTVGGEGACARRRDGSIRCWGANDAGQVGDGTRTRQPSPVPVDGLGLALNVVAGALQVCAPLYYQGLACWGKFDTGNGDLDYEYVTTPRFMSNAADALEVAPGSRHTCARSPSGEIECWGSNGYGQCRDN